MSTRSLVLIGPAACGKSTVGALVAERLGVPFVDLDDIGDDYYSEVGWSVERLIRRTAEVGRVAAEREWEPARAHALERVISEHPGAVIAMGAGHTSYTDSGLSKRANGALRGTGQVVLLLPSVDRDKSLAELRRRAEKSKNTDWISDGHDFLAEWLDDAGMHAMATIVVVTDGERPEATAERLIGLIQGDFAFC